MKIHIEDHSRLDISQATRIVAARAAVRAAYAAADAAKEEQVKMIAELGNPFKEER